MEDIFTLLDEHRAIRATLGALEDATAGAREDGAGYLTVVSLLVGKLSYLVMELHHPREELVFRAVEECRTVSAPALDRITTERRAAARLLKRLESRLLAPQATSAVEVEDLVAHYVAATRRLLDDEENVLYPSLCLLDDQPAEDVAPAELPAWPSLQRARGPTILLADDG